VPAVRAPGTGGVVIGPAATDPGPPGSPADAIRVWTRGGDGVLYEYRDGVRLTELTYANERGRDYYRAGDVILIAKHERRFAEMIFPELRAGGEDDFNPLAIAMLFLGVEEPEYTVGWRILRISHFGHGQGQIIMQGVIFFDDKVPVPLKKVAEWTPPQLNENFIYSRTAVQLLQLIPLIKFTMELAMVPIGGIGKEAVAALGRQFIRRGIVRVMIKVGRLFERALLASCIAFFKAFTKDFERRYHLQQLRARVGHRERGGGVPRFDVGPSVAAGAAAFAVKLLELTLEAPMVKPVEKFFADVGGLTETSVGVKCKTFITQEVIKLCTTEQLKQITEAVGDAANKSLDGKGKFTDLFAEAYLEKLKGLLSKKVGEWPKELAKELIK
jgi:hypothetical protein